MRFIEQELASVRSLFHKSPNGYWEATIFCTGSAFRPNWR